MIRRLLRWYYYRRYGVCPIHLELCRPGGGYEPKWICNRCDEENRQKHVDRELVFENRRVQALTKVEILERRKCLESS